MTCPEPAFQMQANPDPTPPATSSWALIAQATGHPRASTGQLGTSSPSAPGPEETVQGSRSEAFPAASPVPSVETTVKASAHTPTSRPPPVRPLVPGHPPPQERCVINYLFSVRWRPVCPSSSTSRFQSNTRPCLAFQFEPASQEGRAGSRPMAVWKGSSHTPQRRGVMCVGVKPMAGVTGQAGPAH